MKELERTPNRIRTRFIAVLALKPLYQNDILDKKDW